MERRTIEVVVPHPDATKKLWLAPDLSWVDSRERAAHCHLYASTTPRERQRMEALCAEWTGSAKQWGEAVGAMLHLQARAQVELTSLVWPDGPPKAETDQERQEQAKAIDAAWLTWESDLREQVIEAVDRVQRMRTMARWTVCRVRVPPGWEDYGAMEVDDLRGRAIGRAFEAAIQEADLGNG